MNKLSPCILFLFLLLQQACKVFEGEVPVPAYVYVKPFKLITNTKDSTGPDGKKVRLEGQASQQIPDVWFFQDNALRGTFLLPALVPVQKTGSSELIFEPGIELSGQNEERTYYPMYTVYTRTVDLKPLQTDTIEPEIRYVPGAGFELIEDFDGQGFQFEYDPRFKHSGDTVMPVKGAGAWDSIGYSGLCKLGDNSDVFQIYTPVYSHLVYNVPTYFEFDYKGNVFFHVGLITTNINTGEVTQFPVISVLPKAGWNKIYLNMTTEVSASIAKNESQMRLFIEFDRSGNPDVSNFELYLDNLKFVHF